jgi:hypothetical protein
MRDEGVGRQTKGDGSKKEVRRMSWMTEVTM